MIKFFEEKLNEIDPNWVETDFNSVPSRAPVEISTANLTDLCLNSTKKYFSKYETNVNRFGIEISNLNITHIEPCKVKGVRGYRFSFQCMKDWLINNEYIIAKSKAKTNHLSSD